MAYPNAHRVRTQKGDRRGLAELELIYHNVRQERSLVDGDRDRDTKKAATDHAHESDAMQNCFLLISGEEWLPVSSGKLLVLHCGI